MANKKLILFSSDVEPSDKKSFKQCLSDIARSASKDFITTNKAIGTKAAKFGAGVIAASYFAKATETYTPLAWTVFKRMGPIPAEFIKSGTIQLYEFTTFQRIIPIAMASGMKFVFVTISFETGVLIGSIANQFLSQETKDMIGEITYEIIYEEGWKDLWRHPFGYGIGFGPVGERLIDY